MPEDTLDPDVTQFSVETVHTAPQRSSCWTRLRVGVPGVQSAMNSKPGCSVPSSDEVPPTIQQLNLEFGAYICQKPGCGRSFTRPHELEAHMSYHNEEGGYVCKVPGCEMRFQHSEILTRHERIHARHKIYVCDICQKKIIGSENWEIHKIVHSLEVIEVDSLHLPSPVNHEANFRLQQQPSTRFPLLQACTSTGTVNKTRDINADMAANALDSSVSNTLMNETSDMLLPSAAISYQGQQGVHNVPIISEATCLFAEQTEVSDAMDDARYHYWPHGYQLEQPQTSSRLSELHQSLPGVTENARPNDTAISNTNSSIHYQLHRYHDESYHTQQPLSDPSIQPEFTADATDVPISNDIVISDTNSSILYQSPRYNNQQFESQQSSADFPTVRLFIPANTGLTRSMNSTINFNRSSDPHAHQQDNQLYQSQQSLPGPSIQHISEAENTHLLQPFDTTHAKSKSSCLYQDPTYVDQFYQQQHPLPERTLEQTIGPVARRSTNIVTDNVNKNSGDYGHVQNTSLLYQHQILPGPRSRQPNRQITKGSYGDVDSSGIYARLDVTQRSCPQLPQLIQRLPGSGTVVPSVASETANTAESTEHSSDCNTVLSAPSRLATNAVGPTHSSTLPPAPVLLVRPEYQEIHNAQLKGCYRCKEPGCGLAFKIESELKEHIRWHNRRGDYICTLPDCKMRFETKKSLHQHMITHKEEKTYRCEFCNAPYYRRDSLMRHMRIHGAKKVLAFFSNKCNRPGCGKSYRSRNQLRAHMRWHDRKGEHGCQWTGCEMRFHTTCSLGRHASTHSEEKRFKCDFCHKKFTHQLRLTAHMQDQHRGKMVCNKPGCGKVLTNRNYVTAHMRWHEGVEKHICDVPNCWTAFPNNHALQRHMKSHTGEKPFECGICKKCFAQKENLNRHTILHTREGSPETRSTENQETMHPGTTDEVLAEEELSRVEEDGKEGEK